MGAFGSLYGDLQRKLYMHASTGERLNDLKSDFCRENGISARHFNALRMELEGKISGTVELLKVRKKDIVRALGKTERTLKQLSAQIKTQEKHKENDEKRAQESLRAKCKPKAKAFDQDKYARLRRKKHGQKRRLSVQKSKLADVTKHLKADVPGICFGSRELFNKQFHLELTEFGDGSEGMKRWRQEWTDSRNHQFLLVGSKDETAGNQSCKARVAHTPPSLLPVPEPTLTLSVKMPQALVLKGAPALLAIEKVYFNHGHKQVLDALSNGIALTYRFHRDDHSAKGWRVFVSTNTLDAELTSLSSDLGVIGVDFNADHLAWAHVDRFGNASNKQDRFGRIDLNLKGKTSEQREAILSQALDQVFDIAKKFSCPVGMEDLDFAAKKRELSKLGVKHARMLSGLAYSKYQSLARSKASRLGIELIFVDPAYTSVAGSVKYCVRLGRTVHQAAAGVIARRSQGFTEKVPKRNEDGSTTFRAPLMGHTAVLTLPAESGKRTCVTWGDIRKSLTRHCAEQLRLRKEASRNRSKSESVNMQLLNGDTSLFREPGESLARRHANPPDSPDVPL